VRGLFDLVMGALDTTFVLWGLFKLHARFVCDVVSTLGTKRLALNCVHTEVTLIPQGELF